MFAAELPFISTQCTTVETLTRIQLRARITDLYIIPFYHILTRTSRENTDTDGIIAATCEQLRTGQAFSTRLLLAID